MQKQSYLDNLDIRISKMTDYLLLKVEEKDWHAIADAAMDIRELVAQKEVLNLDLED